MSGAAGRPCLLINPSSFRASRLGRAGRAARLARRHGLEVIEASNPGQFRDAFEQLRARGQSPLWIFAGDGTIHALAEFLAERGGEWRPALLLLAGGRANIVPRDCGGYPAMPRLRRALAARAAGRALPEETLHTLKVSQAGGKARHGFLLVGGMLHEGVRLCSEHRASGTGWLHRSFFADPYVLLKLLLQVWMGRSPLPEYATLRVEAPGAGTLAAPMRLLLASTLALRNALYNPFAARGAGPVRITAIAASAKPFWRRLPAVMGGRFDDTMDVSAGILSGRCPVAEVHGMTGFALDGECFPADPALPLRLEPGIALRVLRP